MKNDMNKNNVVRESNEKKGLVETISFVDKSVLYESYRADATQKYREIEVIRADPTRVSWFDGKSNYALATQCQNSYSPPRGTI